MDILQVIAILVAGGGLYKFLEFLITRKDGKNKELIALRKEIAGLKKSIEKIQDEIKESQRDRKRQQLLTMMYHNPTNIDTICEIARVYFEELDGNWYMDSEFQRWLDEQKVPAPSWFNKK